MKPVPKFDDAKQYWLSGKKLNEISRAIEERTPIAGPGLESKTLPQGVILTTNAQAQGQISADHPFRISLRVVSGRLLLSLTPGAFNGDVAIFDAVPLDDDPKPELDIGGATASGDVYLELSATVTFESQFAVSHTPIVAEVKFAAVMPDDTDATGTYTWNWQIGKIVDGEVWSQTVINSLSGRICDNGPDSAVLVAAY
jgi:hypothetical protein